MPRPRLVLPECLEEIILALICEPRHVFLSAKVGSMADIAMVLFRECVTAGKTLRIAGLDGWHRRWQLCDCVRHVLEIVVAQSFGIVIHRRGNAQPLAKHEQLNKRVWRRLASEGRDIGRLRPAILTMARQATWQSLLGQRAGRSRNGRQQNRELQRDTEHCRVHTFSQMKPRFERSDWVRAAYPV